jgi:hypothetical protein
MTLAGVLAVRENGGERPQEATISRTLDDLLEPLGGTPRAQDVPLPWLRHLHSQAGLEGRSWADGSSPLALETSEHNRPSRRAPLPTVTVPLPSGRNARLGAALGDTQGNSQARMWQDLGLD